MTSLHLTFSKISDPRVAGRSQHLLIDIISISILAVLCGAESWDSIELYGKSNREFLKQFLKLPNGIPSHDTIRRVFSIIEPRQFERLFIEWAGGLRESGHLKKVIAIDGKTVRGSKDSFHGKQPIHLVHAWSVANGICLGQRKTEEKSNEITAIPELLELIHYEGNIITIDAMGTQTAIAQKITDGFGDYILAVKDNQPHLKNDVESLSNRVSAVKDYTEKEQKHGRIETRRCEVFLKDVLVDSKKQWAKLQSVIKITSTRELPQKTTTEVRYYISSLDTSQPFHQYIRNHWEIENKLHWTLDVVFREDYQRKRDKHSATNFALIRKIGLNLLKKDTSTKSSLVSKRLMAGWSQEYLISLLKF